MGLLYYFFSKDLDEENFLMVANVSFHYSLFGVDLCDVFPRFYTVFSFKIDLGFSEDLKIVHGKILSLRERIFPKAGGNI